jgi:hypothetical protein
VKRRKTTLDERAAALKAKLNRPAPVDLDEKPLPFKKVVARWGQSSQAARDHFKNVKDVERQVSPPRWVGGRKKRTYSILLVTPSILEREIRKRMID